MKNNTDINIENTIKVLRQEFNGAFRNLRAEFNIKIQEEQKEIEYLKNKINNNIEVNNSD